MVVLVVRGDERLVADALSRAGADGDVIVVEASCERLEALEQAFPDPRLWYQIGDAEVVPLPDDFVDAALGEASPDVERVVR